MGSTRSLALAGALLAGCVLIIAFGLFVVFVSGAVCDYACDELSDDRFRAGAVPTALTWFLLSPAVAIALRRAGRPVRSYGWPASFVAALLVGYALGVGAVAWDFANAATIQGDREWLTFWGGSVAGWLLLAGVLIWGFGRSPSG